jgi:nucleosome assembly protein 1-like 1
MNEEYLKKLLSHLEKSIGNISEIDVDDGNDVVDDEDEDTDEDDWKERSPMAAFMLKRMAQIKELHDTRTVLMAYYMQDRIELEKKYELLLQPIYEERAKLVKFSNVTIGDVVDTTETTQPSSSSHDDDDAMVEEERITPSLESLCVTKPNEDSEDGNNNNDDYYDGVVVDGQSINGVSQFWARAIIHVPVIANTVNVEDFKCLVHLTDVTCTYYDNGKGYTLTFHFEPNEYFTNTTLTKSYEVLNLLVYDEKRMCKSITGTTIDWKENMSLTHQIVIKKQRLRGKNNTNNSKQTRSVTKLEEKQSFFRWFKAPNPLTPLKDCVNDFEIAQAFRHTIVPNAVVEYAKSVRNLYLYTYHEFVSIGS